MTHLIETHDLVIERDGTRILDGVSMHLDKAEKLAIIGSNGAGKTTFLRALIGLQKATAGRIHAFGHDRRAEKDFHDVRLRAAYLFQDADDQLFCPSVVEDVAFGPLNQGLSEDEAMDKARATLARLGLSALAPRVTRKLSGGEKRLVCLAAILAMEPDVLLLDEPTNSLDSQHVEKLVEILKNLDIALIMVSHDRPVLDRIATRALLMKDGRLEHAVLHRHPHMHEHVHIHADHDHA